MDRKRKRESEKTSDVVPFIECCDDGTYNVHAEAIEFLSSLEGPIGVVSIIGPYRTGKSTLLNRCLLGNQILNVGSTVNACTKGILLVKKLLEGPKILDGNTRSLPVIILDTEGLGSIDATNTHDVRIFSMALLLSSLFMYNSVGSIDENALTNLSLVANICKTLRLDSGDEKENDGDDSAGLQNAENLGREAFPPLLWIVRDFALQLVNPRGEQISPSQYLEQSLEIVKGDNNDLMREKNNLRKYIKACFPLRQCITMVRPVTDESMLQSFSKNVNAPVRKLFEEQMTYIRNFVLFNVREKQIKGNAGYVKLTGKSLITYAQSIVESINAGKHPVIRDTWSLIASAQYTDAMIAAKKKFTVRAKESVTAEDIESAFADAIEYFECQPLPTGKERNAKLCELKAQLEEEKSNYLALMSKIAESELTDLMSQMNAAVGQVIEETMTIYASLDDGQELVDYKTIEASISTHMKRIRAIKTAMTHAYVAFMNDTCCSSNAVSASSETVVKNLSQKMHQQYHLWLSAQNTALLKSCSVISNYVNSHKKINDSVAIDDKLSDEVTRLTAELSASEARVAASSETIELLESKLKSALDDIESQSRRCNQMVEKLESLQEETCEKTRQSTEDFENRVKEIERVEQTKYMKQLEEMTVKVEQKLSDSKKKFEDYCALKDEKLQQFEETVKHHEAAVEFSKGQVSELKQEISRMRSEILAAGELRLKEQLEWAGKISEIEKELVRKEFALRTLENLYDPAVATELRNAREQISTLTLEAQARKRDIARLGAELDDANAARLKWQKLYYDDHCKHREEILLSKYNQYAPQDNSSKRARRAVDFSDKNDNDEEDDAQLQKFMASFSAVGARK